MTGSRQSLLAGMGAEAAALAEAGAGELQGGWRTLERRLGLGVLGLHLCIRAVMVLPALHTLLPAEASSGTGQRDKGLG